MNDVPFFVNYCVYYMVPHMILMVCLIPQRHYILSSMRQMPKPQKSRSIVTVNVTAGSRIPLVAERVRL